MRKICEKIRLKTAKNNVKNSLKNDKNIVKNGLVILVKLVFMHLKVLFVLFVV